MMTDNKFNSYVRWITPTVGDPTYSLLRAHLLFEQLIDSSLEKELPHPSALKDARLTFAQKLAIARAASSSIPPSHWTWQAVAKLNKIRNSLAHNPDSKIAIMVKDYVDFCVKHSNHPLPEPDICAKAGATSPSIGTAYSAADLVTLGLYVSLAISLGFNLEGLMKNSAVGAA